jgi:hypothetical protein
MSKVIFDNYTAEDYRKLMLRSSRVDGVSYPRPLYETDPEKWAEMFDATRERVKEPNYTVKNIITAVLGVALILIYHFC